MPIDKKLYQLVIPLKADATKVYSKNSIRQAINENDYISKNKVDVRIVKFFKTEEEAFKYEAELTKQYRQ